MQTTKLNSNLKKPNTGNKQDDPTRSLELKGTSSPAIQPESSGLSKALAVKLMTLIDEVNKQEVTAESVNASCNAAAQIYKILRLNYDMKKEGF